jgi:mersacidin/lichenicidin family type 2 lantibiotic
VFRPDEPNQLRLVNLDLTIHALPGGSGWSFSITRSTITTKEKREMTKPDIIRAWKDEEYRCSLSESERAVLPQDPAGVIELSDSELRAADGGTTVTITLPICNTNIFTMSCITACPTIV